ncbi:MAG: M13 family metallopeptidase, partial [Bacteroidetes bacterium]|nr:M13 family metallopeptidase [Bacteroidota bacterium]
MKATGILSVSAISAIILFTAFTQNNPKTDNPGAGNPDGGKKGGFCLQSIDQDYDPRYDFYNYANGAWLRDNPVPETESAWGSFLVLRDHNEQILKTILEQAASSKNINGSIRQKVGDFFLMAMDTIKLEKEGIKPIEADIAKIKAIKSNAELPAITAEFHSKGISPFFSFYVMQDAKDSETYITYTSQGGLGLPDRDYYFKEDEKSLEIKEAYKKHIQKTFELLNYNDAAKMAASILKIETALAEASMKRTELRNMELLYNKMTFKELKAITPEFNWDLYLKDIGMKPIENIIVTQPNFFIALNKLLQTSKIEDIKTYYTWNLIRSTSSRLNKDFEENSFAFYGTVLSGAKMMKPRWQKALSATNENLGEALGQLYVAKAFSPESKEKVNIMVDNLTLAFRERILQLDWMTDSTKQKALAKLEAFDRKLGYPDKWKDYTNLSISKISYVDNIFRARKFEHQRMVNKLGKPIDRTEWGMSPQTVNAYYSSFKNEIVFPAAIMQPPFFNPEADDAVNYGSMGAVIGHEITHGFDDQGSKYDGKGNLNNWWSEEDKEKFKARTKVIESQFNAFEAMDGLYVNGELT